MDTKNSGFTSDERNKSFFILVSEMAKQVKRNLAGIVYKFDN